ncbi:hypothetical protein BC941DRAFT_257866 [Chlamydoabsidia padenii]|nr:hypothetical protein BC941DRAFT_257866 [Chlamydoabsidia padenii]
MVYASVPMKLSSSPSSSSNILLKSTRRFSPLVIYHEDAYQKNQTYPNIDDDNNNENQMAMHRLKIQDMLNRNAQWWTQQKKITHTSFSDPSLTSLYKRGFVSTMTTNKNNHDIDMLTSSSTSSTTSNSSCDSNDSLFTTPSTASTMMSMSTLMISHPSTQAPSPTIAPMEPKTDMPPPPLYQPGKLFTAPDQQPVYRHHRHSIAGLYHHQPEKAYTSLTLSSPTEMPSSSVSSTLPSSSPRSSVSSLLNTPYSPHCEQYLDNDKDDYYNDSAKVLPLGAAAFDTGLGLKKRRRGNLPKHVTEFLKCWLLQHKKHPYPTERQKLELAQRTGLAVNQISNWFINARRRILQPMLETEQLLVKQQQQQQHQQQQQQIYYKNTHQSSSSSSSSSTTHQTRQYQSQQHYSQYAGYPTEDRKRRQLDIYAYHGFTGKGHKGKNT